MKYGITPIVQRLLIINIAVLAIALILKSLELYGWLPLYGFYSDNFLPYQFVTSMFMHADFRHLLGNMIGLIIFGPILETFIKGKKFLILYMVCGIGSSFLFWGGNAIEVHMRRSAAIAYVADPGPDQFAEYVSKNYPRGYDKSPQLIQLIEEYAEQPENPVILIQTAQIVNEISSFAANSSLAGASGAIFGIMMAMALLFPNTELALYFLPPIKVKFIVGLYGLWEIYEMFTYDPQDNTAHFAHIAGMLFAFIMVRYWKTDRNSFY